MAPMPESYVIAPIQKFKGGVVNVMVFFPCGPKFCGINHGDDAINHRIYIVINSCGTK